MYYFHSQGVTIPKLMIWYLHLNSKASCHPEFISGSKHVNIQNRDFFSSCSEGYIIKRFKDYSNK